jgi:hypothetical protein
MTTKNQPAELKILKGRNGRILRAVMNAIIPRGGAFAPGAADLDLLPRAEEIVMSYDPAIRSLIPVMLNYIQISALFRRGKPFTGLGEGKAIAFLSSLEMSRFFFQRTIMLFMKLLTMLTFYESDDMARLTGYEHGCRMKTSPQPPEGGL